MSNHIQVFTTTNKKINADQIAITMVERRLAACAQVAGPIASTYWWKGKIEKAREWLCILKSNQNLYPELEKAIREIHSYDVPEILAVPVIAGNPDYLRWLDAELQ